MTQAKIKFLLLAIFSATGFVGADENATLYTSGWFYVPGISREIDECLVIEVEGGEILIEFFNDFAPNHVARIKTLASAGEYDQVVFHRVIDGFMAQTGDVQYGKSDQFNAQLIGSGGSNLADLDSEFNTKVHLRGVCSMARSSSPNSANSQFFICLADSTFLDGQYTVWGQVIEGMSVVDQIKKGSGSNNGSVSDPDPMKKVYLRQMPKNQLSGWLYTNQSTYPYFYDALTKHWIYFDATSEKPRYYNYQSKEWMLVE